VRLDWGSVNFLHGVSLRKQKLVLSLVPLRPLLSQQYLTPSAARGRPDGGMGEGMTNESEPGGVTPIGGDLTGVRFLTVAEVAALMRVSKMSVYRLIHNGELEAVRFGRSFRVPERAVHAYLRDAFFETG
jgi:excisionase family DNA binding protein